MLKSKILISLLTGSISLLSLGTITVVANPTGTSDWIARNIMGQNAQQAADDGLLSVLTNWTSSTIPIESADSDEGEAATGPETEVGQIDTVAAATTQLIESVLNQSAPSPVDAVASASTRTSTSLATSGAGTSVAAGSSTDVVASASTRLSTASGSSGTTSGTTNTPVDTIASASQPKPGSTAAISPADQAGLITLKEAIDIALAASEDAGAVYIGYEFENDYPPVYEIFLTSGSKAYEIEIHATLGTVLEKKSESFSSEVTGEIEEHDGETDGGGEHEVDD
jgi:uncharacterized membrane protein YkoI